MQIDMNIKPQLFNFSPFIFASNRLKNANGRQSAVRFAVEIFTVRNSQRENFDAMKFCQLDVFTDRNFARIKSHRMEIFAQRIHSALKICSTKFTVQNF